MIFSKLIEYYKWIRTKFPTIKQLEKIQLEEKLKVDKEMKKKLEELSTLRKNRTSLQNMVSG